MKRPLLQPLDRDVREALDLERGALSGPDDAKARVLERVTSTLGVLSTSVAGGRSEPGSGPRVATRLRTGAHWWASPLWHLVSFALGTVAGALAWRATQAPLPPRVVYVDRSPPATSAPPPAATTSAAPLASGPAPTSPQAPASAPASPGESLAAERALLDVARSAFGRGEGDEALAALARHERLFPGGQLAEEREALAVRSLILARRASEARARAARFRKRYPTSVMLPAVEASLDGAP
jgi:hypothetical protein